MNSSQREAFAAALGAGLYAACALGYINRAAHESASGARVALALFGLYAALGAWRMAGPRAAATAVAPGGHRIVVFLGVLAPLAARAEGRSLWEGGWWVSAAGGLLGIVSVLAIGASFGILPASRGVVVRGPYRYVRHPMTTALGLIAGGWLMCRWSPWNAGVLGTAILLGVVSAFLEERVLRAEFSYREYAARVPWRFVPKLI